MGFKAITINTEASEPAHILAQDDATLYNHIVGADCVLDVGSKMPASIISNNIVRIGDGAVIVQGHLGRTPFGEYDDLVIENGTAGQKRHDLIVAKFQTVAGIDTFELAVLKGIAGATATDPYITVGDLNQGDSLREYPLYRVKLDGLSIIVVEEMFTVGITIDLLYQALLSHKADMVTQLALKANKELDTVYNATLSNGWTGQIQCNKNDLGQVWIRGNMVPGTKAEGTIAFYLSEKYKPRSASVQIIGRQGGSHVNHIGFVLWSENTNLSIQKPASDNVATGEGIAIDHIYQGYRE